MSAGYTGIQWNPQKKRYDAALAALVLLALAAYAGVSLLFRPRLTVETLLIRGTAVTAFVLLHVILCIGPLARLDRRYLPLLYNRRHLGVTMFLLALAHAALATFQFHALGNLNPLVSVLTAYRREYDPFDPAGGLAHFPFEPFGVAALLILFLMAATSHDFWLKNLGPSFWKVLHLGVLFAYGLLVAHVAYGTLQTERNPLNAVLLAAGVLAVLGLHVAAARRESRSDRVRDEHDALGFVRACRTDSLHRSRGRSVRIGGERVAVFLHEGRVYAVSNVCRHQGGPLGEGRIIDGCITCPWHGWQYRPGDGQSPPPFEERIETYRVRVVEGWVWVHPEAAPPGTPQDGADVRGSLFETRPPGDTAPRRKPEGPAREERP